jgi:mitochondrial splicing suppressor protein 51
LFAFSFKKKKHGYKKPSHSQSQNEAGRQDRFIRLLKAQVRGKVMDPSNENTETRICTTCKISESSLANALKRCAKCQTTPYCSRKCQQADWKSHKKVCNKNKDDASPFANAGQTDGGGEAVNPDLERLEQTFKMFSLAGGTADVENIFNSPVKPGYLSRLPEHKAFAAIADSYRLRVEDEYKFRGDAGGLYAGENPLPLFQEFLDQAEQCGDVLPSWWDGAKRRACERQAMRSSEWSCLKSAVEKSDIIKHYGDRLMPMRLRMLAERVTGSHVGAMG